MRLNNKGFATTAIMYSILALIIMLLLGSLAYLASRKKVLDKIKNDTYNVVNDILSSNEYDFSYNGSYQTFSVPLTGYYKIEAWGAQGGGRSVAPGGKGAYTSGYIFLNKGEKIYVYVGNSGYKPANLTKPFNGGGAPDTTGTYAGSHAGEYAGGGATDIRYFGSATPTTAQLEWDSDLGLNSRIMVAGGGGGGNDNPPGTQGGYGGTLLGGTTINPSTNAEVTKPTQRSGFSFGTGQSSGVYGTEAGADTGAGGGGYYGGYRGTSTNTGGSGGSSFISGYAGVNAITSSTSRTATNNTKHYSGKYFIGGTMESGINSGNGRAKITYIGSIVDRKDSRLNSVRYIKSCANGNSANTANHWVEIQAIKDGINIAKGKTVTGTYPESNNTTHAYSYIVDGMIDNITGGDGWGNPTNSTNACVTIDLGSTYNLDEIAAWNYYPDARTYYNYTVSVSSNNSSWTTIFAGGEAEVANGKRINAYLINPMTYGYTGGQQTFTAPRAGYYKIESWGASGGEGKFNTNAGTELGGAGAYTSGMIYLNESESLYLYVGGAGTNATSNTQHTTIAGGYNGGGNGLSGGSDDQAGSGGGATDVRYGGTSLNARIMVAGGGGGGHCDTDAAYGNNRIKFPLMNGQGLAYTGTLGQWKAATWSVAASQITGNAFGTGGSHTNLEATHGAGGGGGGYYGGVANKNNAGGPGSGGTSYISGYAGVNSVTSSSSTAATGNTKHYSGKYFINGIMLPGANVGNGRIAITYLSSTLERTNSKLNNVRYIKDCVGWNTINTDTHWVEFQAIKDGVNLAKGKTPTGDTTSTLITDGDVTTSKYAGGGAGTSKCITIDLGGTYNLDEMAVWHYYGDKRYYINHVMSVSSDNSSWTTVSNNYQLETSQGKRVSAYVNLDTSKETYIEGFSGWTGGSVSNNMLTLASGSASSSSDYYHTGKEKWYITYEWKSDTAISSSNASAGLYCGSSYYTSAKATATSLNTYGGNGNAPSGTKGEWHAHSWDGWAGFGNNVEYVKISFSTSNSYGQPPAYIQKFQMHGQLYNSFYDITVYYSGDSNTLKVMKYAPGFKEPAYFKTDGINIFNNSFRVTSNGYYTVYVEDINGISSVQQVYVDRIGS